MPEAAPHFCTVPGCSVLTTRTRCPTHMVDVEHARSNWGTRTWYRTPRWKALRARVLREQAYQCARCHVVGDPLDIDHLLPHKGNVDLFWLRENLHALCKRCHSRKTQQGA